MTGQLVLDVGPGREELWVCPHDHHGRVLPALPAHVIGWGQAFKWASVMIDTADQHAPDTPLETVARAAIEAPLLYWSITGNKDALDAVLGANP